MSRKTRYGIKGPCLFVQIEIDMLDLAFWAILILNSFDPSSAEKQNDLTKELVFRTRFRAFSNSFDQIICVRTKIDLKSKNFFLFQRKIPRNLNGPSNGYYLKKVLLNLERQSVSTKLWPTRQISLQVWMNSFWILSIRIMNMNLSILSDKGVYSKSTKFHPSFPSEAFFTI